MEHFDDNLPQRQNQREDTERKRKERKRSTQDDELSPSKMTWSGCEYGPKEFKKRFRDFTEEEHQAFMKKYEESNGFNIGEVPDDVLMFIPYPVCLDQPAPALRPYNKTAKLALDEFNKEEGTTYKFVKLIRANARICCGAGGEYHIYL